MTVRPCKGGLPLLPFVRLGQRSPDSKGPWYPFATDTLDETEAAKAGYYILSPALDLRVLAPWERGKFVDLSLKPARSLSADEQVTLGELRVRIPRLTISGGYDIDSTDPESSAELSRRIKEEEGKRGVTLRECWSGGGPPTSTTKRHLEWGYAEKGCVTLLYAAYGRARDVCKAAGLVRRSATTWALPHDPTGEKGFVDLTNLNRDPATRDSVFRALGALYKDRKHRKVLVAGSPLHGSTFTTAMVEDGLRLYDEQERAGGKPDRAQRQAMRRSTPVELPDEDTDVQGTRYFLQFLDGISQKHSLRLALSGTLVRSELLSLRSIKQLLMVTTNQVTQDTERTCDHILETTLARLRQGLPVAGPVNLRVALGTPNLLALAATLQMDLKNVALMWVWERLSPKKTNAAGPDELALQRLAMDVDVQSEEEHKVGVESVDPTLAKLSEAAAHTEDPERKKLIHRVRRRLASSVYCGRRRVNGRCPVCKLRRCRIHLFCGDPSCASCVNRKIRDVLDLIKFPARTTIATRGGFTSKEEAQRAVSDLARLGTKRPLALYVPTADNGWDVTLMADSDDALAWCMVTGFSVGGELHERLPPHLAMNFVTRALLLKHAAARQAIESGGKVGLEAMINAYRKHVASTRNASVHWPTKDEIRELRKQRALEAAAQAPDADDPEACECPEQILEEHPPRYDVVDEQDKVTIEDLLSPPTLAMVVAHEAGEPVRLHKRRKGWKPRSQQRRE